MLFITWKINRTFAYGIESKETTIKNNGYYLYNSWIPNNIYIFYSKYFSLEKFIN